MEINYAVYFRCYHMKEIPLRSVHPFAMTPYRARERKMDGVHQRGAEQMCQLVVYVRVIGGRRN
jgi:hypothetical protein